MFLIIFKYVETCFYFLLKNSDQNFNLIIKTNTTMIYYFKSNFFFFEEMNNWIESN